MHGKQHRTMVTAETNISHWLSQKWHLANFSSALKEVPFPRAQTGGCVTLASILVKQQA